MTNNAKAILITVLGVVLAGALVVALMAAVIGISLIAAAGEEEFDDNKPAATNGSRRSQDSRVKTARRGGDGDEPEAPPGTIAPELVGTWQHRAGGGETDFTGKTRYGSTRRQTYKIAADGTVEYKFERETLTIMQCEIKEDKTATGKAASDAGALVINFGTGDHAESDSCEGGERQEKTLAAETVRLSYRLQNEDDRVQLCFDATDGEACFDKMD